MRKILFLLCVLLITTISSYAQNIEPLELAKKIFETGHLYSFKKYIIGDYKENNGHPNLNDFKPNQKKKFSLLNQTSNKAVVEMTVTDSLQQGFNSYLHFKKDSIWKMTAFRGLALTGITEQVRDMLEQLTPKQVDSIIESSKKNNLNALSFFSSREEYEFKLGNTKLMLDFDDNIIAHFIKNKDKFEKIKDSVFSLMQHGSTTQSLERECKKLFITGIETDNDNFNNSINFVIGGITDNLVGYVFIKDEKDVPEMDPDNIIMLKPIGYGWYIYKTT